MFSPVDDRDGQNANRHQTMPLESWLSRPAVMHEYERGNGSLPRQGDITLLRDRWDPHCNYIADLLSYGLWSHHSSLRIAQESAAIDSLMRATDLAGAVHRAAYLHMRSALGTPAFRLRLFATALSERAPQIRTALTETYSLVTGTWSDIYGRILKSRNLRLRPGVSLEEITILLTAADQGLMMRTLIDPNERIIDHERHRSLLGNLALALIIAYVDAGDGRSIEEMLDLLIRKSDSTKSTDSRT